MASAEHWVSFRNGSQRTAAGLKLALMEYRRDAEVCVRDPRGVPEHLSWEFVVANVEHATRVCRDPLPPAWIQPGAVVLIQIAQPKGRRGREPATGFAKALPAAAITLATLAEWRRS